jgi:predicted ATPase/DNA-binding SARP family transcriptional activator
MEEAALTMPALHLSLFGIPRFVYEGSEHRFIAPPRALPLLAYILLQRGRIIPREVAANAIWPDDTEADALAKFRRHLHYIKRSLPGSSSHTWIHVTSKTVAWNESAPYQLDVCEFEQLSASASSRAAAVELYRDDLYPSCVDEWIEYERERLRNLQLTNLEMLIKDCRQNGLYAEGAGYARRLLMMDPWREDAVRALMRFRSETGDRSGAIAEYEKFAERLSADLQVDPMPETLAVYEELIAKRTQPVPAPAPTAAAAEEAARTVPEILGRTNEQEILLSAWRRAQQGRGGALFIGGEAGVGKTTLVSHFRLLLTGSGERCYVGITDALGNEPYQPLNAVLYQAMSDADMLQIPQMASAIAYGLPAANLPAESDGLALYASVADVFQRIAQRTPMAIVLEDVHWASAAAFQLLGFLIKRLQKSPVLFICTYREEEVGRGHPLVGLRRQLYDTSALSTIPLNPLDKASIAELASREIGAEAAAKEIDSIYRRSEGNPFFAHEILKNLETHARGELPQTVRAAVPARLQRLSAPAYGVARAAAVIGRSFTIDLLAEITGAAESDLLRALNELIAQHIVRVDLADAGASYAFAHHVIQTVAYETLDQLERRRMHGLVALAFEDLLPEARSRNAHAVAVHYERAAMSRQAAEAYCAASAYAAAIYANDEALEYSRRALDLAADARQKFQALLGIDAVYHRISQKAERADVIKQLDDIAKELGDTALRAETLCRTAELRTAEAEYDAAKLAVERARLLAPATPQWRARLALQKAEIERERTDFEACFNSASEALVLFEESGTVAGVVQAYTLLIRAAYQLGKPHVDLLSRTRDLAVQTQNSLLECRLAQEEFITLAMFDKTAAYAAASRMLDAAVRVGDKRLEGRAHAYMSQRFLDIFDIAQARRHAGKCSEIYEAIGSTEDRLMAERMHAHIEMVTGDMRSAAERYHRTIEVARNEHLALPEIFAAFNEAYCRLWMENGGSRAAMAPIEEAADVIERHSFEAFKGHVFASLSDVYFTMGEVEMAARVIQQALEHRRAKAHSEHLPSEVCFAARIMTAAGREGEARALFDEATELLSKLNEDAEGSEPQRRFLNLALAAEKLFGEQRYREFVLRAHGVVAVRLSRIPDERTRALFLSVPYNAEIIERYNKIAVRRKPA